ncbi:type IV toxin-antitoxin system AbiEi family antitoxin domain-containing protein [Microbacterium sp. CPCC 204701]|uniref:type IV toxin-antitoxin system AbiEi family antitoxin domain-containing protein n=1 Tax=Microbacterium sp. CPCC 204701 TaxID=2493084 RepID=UPI001F0C240D|nr:type IV toxin-antitoxin system AbiEi family antitoxin domain-containing protein [Microbacterium sp. CPCC 204701]
MVFMLRAAPGEVLTRADLRARGMRPKQITREVESGRLLRVRRDRYMSAPSGGVDRAVRVGGRLACVSLLALLGVFVLDKRTLHVHLERTMSRLRHPDDPRRALSPGARSDLSLHWWPLHDKGEVTLGCVSIFDAVAQAIRCQEPRAAVATIDSVLYLGILTWTQVRDVFTCLPDRYGIVLRLVDGVAESGPESLMRLILRQLGLTFRAQVDVPEVGRVDFLVGGWLIIECDSKAHHEGWEKQQRDRRRDLAAAALGFTTLRPLAEDIMYRPDLVVRAVRGLVSARRRSSTR